MSHDAAAAAYFATPLMLLPRQLLRFTRICFRRFMMLLHFSLFDDFFAMMPAR